MKKFHTTEEKSWNREVELYKTQSLAHDNILRYIAADNRDNGSQEIVLKVLNQDLRRI